MRSPQTRTHPFFSEAGFGKVSLLAIPRQLGKTPLCPIHPKSFAEKSNLFYFYGKAVFVLFFLRLFAWTIAIVPLPFADLIIVKRSLFYLIYGKNCIKKLRRTLRIHGGRHRKSNRRKSSLNALHGVGQQSRSCLRIAG